MNISLILVWLEAPSVRAKNKFKFSKWLQATISGETARRLIHTQISLRLIKKPVGISDSVIYESFIAPFIYIKKLFGSILAYFPLFVLSIKLRDAMAKKKKPA